MYEVRLTRSAEKDLDDIAKTMYDRVVSEIDGLAVDPRPFGVVKLIGREDYRIRVGDYRVIYEIDDVGKAVLVTAIRHRREAY